MHFDFFSTEKPQKFMAHLTYVNIIIIKYQKYKNNQAGILKSSFRKKKNPIKLL